MLGFWNSSIRGRVQQSVCSHDGLNIFSVAGCGTLILALQKTLLERCGPKTATGLHLDAMLLPTLLQFFAIVAVAPGTCERPQNASSPFSPAAWLCHGFELCFVVPGQVMKARRPHPWFTASWLIQGQASKKEFNQSQRNDAVGNEKEDDRYKEALPLPATRPKSTFARTQPSLQNTMNLEPSG